MVAKLHQEEVYGQGVVVWRFKTTAVRANQANLGIKFSSYVRVDLPFYAECNRTYTIIHSHSADLAVIRTERLLDVVQRPIDNSLSLHCSHTAGVLSVKSVESAPPSAASLNIRLQISSNSHPLATLPSRASIKYRFSTAQGHQ
jgi:hypothetical protein